MDSRQFVRLYEKKVFIDNKTDLDVEEEFSEKRSYYFSKCKNVHYTLEGTVSNIFFENCENCSVLVENVIAKLEVLRSSDIYIGVTKEADTRITIQLDLSYEVEIEIEHPCLIQTVSCIDVSVNENPLPCSMFSDICHFEIESEA